jgi:hypothetical protein
LHHFSVCLDNITFVPSQAVSIMARVQHGSVCHMKDPLNIWHKIIMKSLKTNILDSIMVYAYIAKYDDNGQINFNHVLVNWYGISLSSRIHFYLCQLSILVFSDFMIILCQMFNGSFMWHTLPCCTLAIIDTAKMDSTWQRYTIPVY